MYNLDRTVKTVKKTTQKSTEFLKLGWGEQKSSQRRKLRQQYPQFNSLSKTILLLEETKFSISMYQCHVPNMLMADTITQETKLKQVTQR